MNMSDAYDIIRSDIRAGDMLLAEGENGNKHLFALAAYHYVQAAEKCLKSFIQEVNPQALNYIEYKHDFKPLIKAAEESNGGRRLLRNCTELRHSTRVLSLINNTRYGGVYVRKGIAQEIKRILSPLYENYRHYHYSPNRRNNVGGEPPKLVRFKLYDNSQSDKITAMAAEIRQATSPLTQGNTRQTEFQKCFVNLTVAINISNANAEQSKTEHERTSEQDKDK